MATEGFRVRLNLSRHFVDERSRALLWIERGDGAGDVGRLEARLRRLFGLADPFCLCLDASPPLLLPSTEPLSMLLPDDELVVVPIKKSFAFERDEDEPPENIAENIAETTVENVPSEKELKKKKRKKQKELAENLEIDEIVDRINGKDKSSANKENSPVSTPDAASKKKKPTSVEVRFATAIENIKKMHKDQLASSQDDSESLKLKALTMMKDAPQPNAVGISDGRITKRKRVRVRKNKKNNSSAAMMNSLSDVETNAPHRNNGIVLLNGKVNSHLRFAHTEPLPVTVLRNSSQSGDEQPRVIRAIQTKSQDGDLKKSHGEEESESQINNEIKLSGIIPYVDNYPIVRELPKENDVILFKTLKIDEQYNPVLSDYVLGRVRSIDSSLVNFTILEGQSECVQPNGKFSLVDEDESDEVNDSVDDLRGDDDDLFTTDWGVLIEPRVIR